jgi:hypothetical protein
MSLMEILQPYAARPTSTEQDFDDIAPQVPPEVLGDGLAQAFRSDQTPPFSDMVQQLFGHSNPRLRAGLLNQLIRTVGPAALANIAGGLFGRMAQAQGGRSGAGSTSPDPTITPDDAERVSAEQIGKIVAAAEKKDPSVVDRVSGFYGQHPDAVKMLGGAALAIALGRIAQRMNH